MCIHSICSPHMFRLSRIYANLELLTPPYMKTTLVYVIFAVAVFMFSWISLWCAFVWTLKDILHLTTCNLDAAVCFGCLNNKITIFPRDAILHPFTQKHVIYYHNINFNGILKDAIDCKHNGSWLVALYKCILIYDLDSPWYHDVLVSFFWYHDIQISLLVACK